MGDRAQARPLAALALTTAAAVVLTAATDAAWLGPRDLGPIPLAVGPLLGLLAAARWPALRSGPLARPAAAAAAAALVFALCVLAPPVPAVGAAGLPLALLAAAAVAPGAAAARAAASGGAAPAARAAGAGLAAGLVLARGLDLLGPGWAADLARLGAAAGLAVGAEPLARAARVGDPRRPARLDRATLAGLPAGARLGAAVWVGGGVLAFGDAPAPHLAAATWTGLAAAGGAVLAPGRPDAATGWTAYGVLEVLGWLLLGALAAVAPSLAASGVALLLTAVGACAGLAASGPRREAGGVVGLLLGLLLTALAPAPAWSPAAGLWSEGEALAFALGTPPGERAAAACRLGEPGDEVRLRFRSAGLPVVAVVDVGEGARLLTVDGRPAGTTPTHAEAEARTLLRGPAFLAALPLLLAAEAPAEVAVVGLEAGVAPATALRAEATSALWVVEPRRAVVAAHLDPGDLFGLAHGHLFGAAQDLPGRPRDPRLHVSVEPTWPFLRRSSGGFDAILLARPDPPAALLDLARRRSRGPVAARLRLAPGARADGPRAVPLEGLRAFLAAFPDAWAFYPEAWDAWPAEATEVLLVGALGRVAPARVAERWAAEAEGLAAGLREVHATGGPEQVLSRALADAAGLRRFLRERPNATVEGLARTGAGALPDALALPDDDVRAAALLAALADTAARRNLPLGPAAARAAVDRARTGEALRVLGDIAYRGRLLEQAEALWREALEREPEARAPRISLATLYRSTEQPAEAVAVLEEGLRGDPAADATLHYQLGEVAEEAGEYRAAAEHFASAGDVLDAAERAARARRRVTTPAQGATVGQKLEAAALRLERARAEPAEATRLRTAALDALYALADGAEGELTPAERLRLARLLATAADLEPLAPLRPSIYRRAAAALAPAAGATRPALFRADLLLRGERPAEAEAVLRDLIAREGARAPRAHLLLGRSLAAQDRPADAIEALERGLRQAPPAPTDAWAFAALARLLGGAGDDEAAVAALERGLEVVPDHPDLLLALGRRHADHGRAAAARLPLERLLDVVARGDPRRAAVEELLAGLGE